MATDDACPRDALRCARVTRPVVPRVYYVTLLVPSLPRHVCRPTGGRDSVVIFMSHGHVSLSPPHEMENVEIPAETPRRSVPITQPSLRFNR